MTLWPSDPTAQSGWPVAGGGPVNPQELNRYAYALNNPLRYTDPTGHLPFLAAAMIVGAVVNVGLTIATTTILEGRQPTAGEYMSALVTGAVGGALTAVGGPMVGMAASVIRNVQPLAVVAQPLASATVHVALPVVAEIGGGMIGAGVDAVLGTSARGPDLASSVGAGVAGVASYGTGAISVPFDGKMTTWREVQETMGKPVLPRWMNPDSLAGQQRIRPHLAIRAFTTKAAMVNAALATVFDGMVSAVTRGVIDRQ